MRKRFLTKQDIEIYLTVAALIVNVAAILYVVDTIKQNSDIIKTLSDQVKLQRANLVRTYLDFKPDFSISFPKFYPLQQDNPSLPMEVTNLSKYLTKIDVWIYPEEICPHHGRITTIETNNAHGMPQILDSDQTSIIEIPIVETYAKQLDNIDSMIVKVVVISNPFDRNVESINELEKIQHFYIQYEKLSETNAFFPIFVEDGKIECPVYLSFNENVIVTTPHKWIYSGYDKSTENPNKS